MTDTGTGSFSWKRNNLGSSSSPYLRQHAGNPVWWQEWSSETLAMAAAGKKPLLVSVGYATCHWCHVMAAEAFSDPETADFLNEHFVCIKADREQRPDIDQYMMTFIQAQSGSGGWPLNVFLTHDMRPVHALTYAPARTAGNRYSLLDISRAVVDFLEKQADRIVPFSMPDQESPHADADRLAENLSEFFDSENGGFGFGQKFPPHSTLLFMLYRMAADGKPERIIPAAGSGNITIPDTGSEAQAGLTAGDHQLFSEMVTATLDAMMMRGLNDHLQGGIYRYCVDREWTVPHFEKMLYDQAMALWTYSLASRVTGLERYRKMAEKIVRCLDESFMRDGMYVTAFNADTGHKEGATYLWGMAELAGLLTPEELGRLSEVYDITGRGNFEGLNHLVRKNAVAVEEIEEKLLAVRKQRSQPSCDDKILSGLNALTAVALTQAGRMLDRPDLEVQATALTWKLLETFWDGTSLAHSYYDGVLQRQGYLSDAAALLLAAGMLYESDPSWGEIMNTLADYVRSFRDDAGRWIESDAADFQRIYASWFDHPVPSAVSLAETALTRVALLTGDDVTPALWRRPYQSDFYNVNVLLTEDLFYLYTTREPLPWSSIPVNSIQRRGEPETVCYSKTCRAL
jgi:uncharacterized protein YyaL (SSP411 family)